MTTLEALFSWILTTTWQASVLALLVLAVQTALGRRLNPRWRHALWLLVLLRLLLPDLPESALSLFRYAPAAPLNLPETLPEPVALPVINHFTVAPQVILPPQPNYTFLALALLWLTGALGLLILTILINHRFARQVARSPQITDPALRKILTRAQADLRLRRHIRLIESPHISSPAIMGLFTPTLLLPLGARKNFTPRELRYIFLHELAHLKRGDVAIQALIAALQILHWFNPVLWYAFRRMRIDREPATDALVLSRTGEADKEPYGLMLLKLLGHFNQRHSLPTLVGILEDKDHFKQRFTLIARFTRRAYGWSLLGVLALTILAAVCLTKSKAETPTAPPANITHTPTGAPLRLQLLAIETTDHAFVTGAAVLKFYKAIQLAEDSGNIMAVQRSPDFRVLEQIAIDTHYGQSAPFISGQISRCGFSALCTPSQLGNKIAITGTLTLNTWNNSIVKGETTYTPQPIPGATYPLDAQVDPQQVQAVPPQGILEPAAANPGTKIPRRLFVFLSAWPDGTAHAAATVPTATIPASLDGVDETYFDKALEDDRKFTADSTVKTSTLAADAQLLTAIRDGDSVTAKKVLEHGAAPHPFDPDRFHHSPVYWAVYFNRPEILNLLFDHMAEAWSGPDNKDPLKLAQSIHPELVPVLHDGAKRVTAALRDQLTAQLHSTRIDLPAFSNAPLKDVVHFLLEATAKLGYLERRVAVGHLDLPASTTFTTPAAPNIALWDALQTLADANQLRFTVNESDVTFYPPRDEAIVHPSAPAPTTSTTPVDADARNITNFKVTDLPLSDLARKITAMTADAENPGVPIEVQVPPGETPLTITYGYPPYSGDLNNLLFHLSLLYPIRYEFRDEADRAHWSSPAPVLITQLSAAEIALNKRAAQTKVSFDFHNTDIVTALKSIQSQAAAKGFAFDLDLAALKNASLPVVSEQAQDWSVQHALASLCYLSGLVPEQLDKFTGYRVSPGTANQLHNHVGIRFGIATALHKTDDATASANLESALSPGKNIAKRTWGPSITSSAYPWTYHGKQMTPQPGEISDSFLYQHLPGMQAGEVEPVPGAPFVDVQFLNTPLDPTRTRIQSDVTVLIKKPDGTVLRTLHGQFVSESGAVVRLIPQGAPLLFDTPGDPKTQSRLTVLVQASYVATDGWESDLGPTDLDLVTPANTLQDVQLADADAPPAGVAPPSITPVPGNGPPGAATNTSTRAPAAARTDTLWASLDADARQVLAEQLKDLPDDQFLAARKALGLDRDDNPVTALDASNGARATPDMLAAGIAEEKREVGYLLIDGFDANHPRIVSMNAEIAKKQKQLHEMIEKLKIEDLADAQQRQANAGPPGSTEAPRVTWKWLLGARQEADARRVLVGKLAAMPDDQFVATLHGLGRADPDITDLDTKIADENADIANLTFDGFDPNHPRIVSLRAEVASRSEERKRLVDGVRRAMDIDLQMADSRVTLLQQASGGTALPDPAALQQQLADAQQDLDARRTLNDKVRSLPDDQWIAGMQNLGRENPPLSALDQKIADENADISKLLNSGYDSNNPRIVSERAEIAARGQERKQLLDGERAAMDIDLAMAQSRVDLLKKQLPTAP